MFKKEAKNIYLKCDNLILIIILLKLVFNYSCNNLSPESKYNCNILQKSN